MTQRIFRLCRRTISRTKTDSRMKTWAARSTNCRTSTSYTSLITAASEHSRNWAAMMFSSSKSTPTTIVKLNLISYRTQMMGRGSSRGCWSCLSSLVRSRSRGWVRHSILSLPNSIRISCRSWIQPCWTSNWSVMSMKLTLPMSISS